jgi:hypothetical protein
MGYIMTIEKNMTVVFRELSSENQFMLLACARLARNAEQADKKVSEKGDKMGPESRFPGESKFVPLPESPA